MISEGFGSSLISQVALLPALSERQAIELAYKSNYHFMEPSSGLRHITEYYAAAQCMQIETCSKNYTNLAPFISFVKGFFTGKLVLILITLYLFVYIRKSGSLEDLTERQEI